MNGSSIGLSRALIQFNWRLLCNPILCFSYWKATEHFAVAAAKYLSSASDPIFELLGIR